jgi:hypothetical protein
MEIYEGEEENCKIGSWNAGQKAEMGLAKGGWMATQKSPEAVKQLGDIL